MRLAAALSAVVGLLVATSADAADYKTLRNLMADAPTSPPPIPAGVEPNPVDFAKIVFHPREGEAWGLLYDSILISTSENKRPPDVFLNWESGRFEAQTDGFARIFAEELSKAGFKPGNDDSLFSRGASDADLRVGVLVEDIKGRFCNDCPNIFQKVKITAVVTMKARWEVYSALQGGVVARVVTEGGFVQSEPIRGSAEPTIYEAFRENVRLLLAAEDFRKVVLAAPGGTSNIASAAAGLTPIALVRSVAPPSLSMSDAAGAVVAVFAGDGHGSAFLVSDEGYLVTNQHVVGGSKYVKVRWSDGFETVGEVIRSDRRRDVALIKTDPRGRTPLALRRGPLQPGEAVFALGTPLDAKFQGTVTKGVVSSTRIFDGFSFIQSDVTVNPGNSGGPLLDEKGAVIGVTVSGYRPTGAPTGINFFIPIGDALDFLNLKPAV
ncbi:MAG: S1C family serine protease [Phenylobacterium sp.]|uniref:S1C family serine protease n=1 Tax=Phenylobacterium sp. TaxID=1871053 RepID=UPI00391B7930